MPKSLNNEKTIGNVSLDVGTFTVFLVFLFLIVIAYQGCILAGIAFGRLVQAEQVSLPAAHPIDVHLSR